MKEIAPGTFLRRGFRVRLTFVFFRIAINTFHIGKMIRGNERFQFTLLKCQKVTLFLSIVLQIYQNEIGILQKLFSVNM